MANGHGGRRAGSGRKPKAQRHEGPILAAEARIVAHLEKAIDNVCALADGILCQRVTPEGTIDVFEKPPDLRANRYLIDRILGRPTQAVEVSGPDGEAVPVDLSLLGIDELRQLRGIARQLDRQRSDRGDPEA
jgi:hypothetical protein